MKCSGRIAALLLVAVLSVGFASCSAAPAEEETVPAVENTVLEESPVVTEDIRLMFYTVEMQGNMTAMVGETLQMHAEVISDRYDEASVEWESSCETSLSIEPGDAPNEATLKVVSTEKSPVMLTLTCGELKKVFPVYIMPDREGRESIEPGEIRLMYYNTELSEFTLREGEKLQLHVEVDGISNAEFEWKSSDESCLTIEKHEESRDALVTAEQRGEGSFVLTVSCGTITKDFPVYIVPAE